MLTVWFFTPDGVPAYVTLPGDDIPCFYDRLESAQHVAALLNAHCDWGSDFHVRRVTQVSAVPDPPAGTPRFAFASERCT